MSGTSLFPPPWPLFAPVFRLRFLRTGAEGQALTAAPHAEERAAQLGFGGEAR